MINEILNVFNANQPHLTDAPPRYYIVNEEEITPISDENEFYAKNKQSEDFLDTPIYNFLDAEPEEINVKNFMIKHNINDMTRDKLLKTIEGDLFRLSDMYYKKKITNDVSSKAYCEHVRNLYNNCNGNIPQSELLDIEDKDYRELVISSNIDAVLIKEVKKQYIKDNVDTILYHVFLASKLKELEDNDIVRAYNYVIPNESALNAVLYRFNYNHKKAMEFLLSEVSTKTQDNETVSTFPIFLIDNDGLINKLLKKLKKKDLV